MQQANGGVLAAPDLAFMDQHRVGCEMCRATAAASALLCHTDDAGPGRPLDELSRRRLVNDVVSQAMAEGPLAEQEVAPVDPAGRPRWRWVAAAALLLGVGATLVMVLRGFEDDGVRVSSKAPVAQLVMRSGEVVVEGAPASVELAVGKTLWVRRGQAALALPEEAYVLLGEGSAARVVRLSSAETTLHLEQGWLLASVPPKHHRRRFVITTRAGRVVIKGTVFTVRVTPERVTVAVVRGQVKLVEPGHSPRLLRRGHLAWLGDGDGATRPLAAAQRSGALAGMASLALLGVGEVARFDVRSQPAGAQVMVDGVVLGRTPLTARLRAGHRHLQLRLAGRTPVGEQLSLKAGDRIHRDYELGLATLASRRSSGSTTRATAPKSPEDTSMEFAPVIVPRPAPRRPAGTVTARELLRRAQKRRAARDWRGAAASYRVLLAKHPASSAARAVRVALGMLLLDHLGNPSGALGLFTAYLRSTRRGVLAQEAAYGRARALRRLGRRAAEQQALEGFLRSYPGALQTALVKRRLQALKAAPKRQQ